nr:Chain G, Diablo homolog, mitochondrial [synthetic construct]1XB0_H Chain H, Diablo homolog, mitochondrial [synthetic construct]1XB0_I Chain I, Diablo homolog, mitochondrial [synthetic construct]1XB0_J Chain J, Diablo homolog, mitochondrial [synthetic construct]1XB0_K Chain K, Diablo homolog, mitochondrial [synthetic construct]1XB0_L Chain L, Diablo homolog, mitochondrial [synthetic construct]1XB1_G Chain G, Diablo homolog, mitochondrial [synthetic construct]1XB1_H Chain H, Diablo homolog,
AVPIAQK